MSRNTVDEFVNTFVDERVNYLIPRFEMLAPFKQTERKKGKGNIQGWESIAVREANLLKQTYPDERPEGEKQYGTCLRQITAIKKGLKEGLKTKVKDPALVNSVGTICTHFGNLLSLLFREYKEAQNLIQREKRDSRTKKVNRIEIDLTNSLILAKQVLEDVKENKLTAVSWKEVSISLALATGRRMVEIHHSGVFGYSDEYEVTFRGQAKGKDRKEKVGNKFLPVSKVTFFLPTLIPAELVVSGIDWLGANGKRIDPKEDAEIVNRRYSKDLNLAVKDWDIFPEDGRTYHKFRAAYLRACIVNDPDVDPYDYIDFAKEILIDNDENTLNAYKRYVIKSGSLTKV